TFIGLLGVLPHPLVHASFGHLLVNTVPLAILGGLIALRGPGELLELSVFVALAEGTVLWLFGHSGAVYVGASGLIVGYFGYLLARGWYERTPGSIVMAVAVLIVYGGLIWSVLPTHTAVAWESHLLGLLAGVLAARLEFRRPSR
ncbi:MAG: rhomboid family intramembrane serine protease, partial [Planctomycetota bacterium]